MQKQQKKAFTLVELIVVITILAILATIGFISYQSYTLEARDSNRITTVKEISKGLDIVYTKKTVYPMPDAPATTGTIDGVLYAYRGTIGDTVSQNLRMTKALDPLSNTEYAYGLNVDKTQYQIAMVLENNKIVRVNNLTNTTYAATTPTAKLNGNYPGYAKYSTGGQSYIANIPSLLWNNNGSVNLMNSGTYYVVDNNTNLPYKLNSATDIGTKDANSVIQDITGTGVASLTGVNITNLTTSNFNSIFTGATLSSFNINGLNPNDTSNLQKIVKEITIGNSTENVVVTTCDNCGDYNVDLTGTGYTHWDSGHRLANVASNLSDNNETTPWYSYSSYTGAVGIDFGAGNGKLINKIRYKKHASCDSNGCYDPKDMKIYGSNQNVALSSVTDWTELTSWTGPSGAGVAWNEKTFTNTNSYRHYKWLISSSWSKYQLIYEWELIRTN